MTSHRISMHSICLALTLCLASPYCMAREEKVAGTLNTVRLCYITFDAETYTGVSRRNFSLKCNDLGVWKQRGEGLDELAALRGKISAGNEFDDHVVRLRLNFSDGGTMYVNQKGEIDFGGKTFKISSKAVDMLRKRLDAKEKQIFGY